MPSLRQLLFGPIATGRTVLRRVRGVDGDDQTTSTFSLRRQGIAELRPRSIGNRLGKAVVLHHALDIEFLDGNHAKAIDQFTRLLMHKVVAAVFDALMHAPNDFLSGLPLFGDVMLSY